MPNTIITTLVLLAMVIIMAASVIFSPKFLTWWDQKLTDRKRVRAHAGKVTCEDPEGCSDVASWRTPNGYFCNWHYEPQSVRRLPNGGKEIWCHVLYHAVRRA